jgi:hypothetical protein
MKLSPIVSLTAALAAVCLFNTHTEADAPPATQPAAIAHVAVGSLNQLAAVADDLQITLPPFLTAAGIEQTFAFVGADGMRKDLPIALDYLAGPNLQADQMALFFFPLTAGHAPIANFVQQGRALGTDAAIVNGVTFRRTGNYLIWGGVPDVVTAIPADKLPDAKQDNPLLEITYDGKLFRQVAPQVLEDYRKSQLDDPANAGKSASELAGQRIGIDAVTLGLDRLLIRLERKEDLFRITTQIEPSPTFTAQVSQKPGLPEGCAFRIDWQPPHDWIRNGLDKVADLTGRNEFFKAVPGGPANQAAFEELMVRGCNSLFSGQTATYGMELLDDGPVFYSVTQSPVPRDVKAEFTDIEARAAKIYPHSDDSTKELSSYKLKDGTLVERLMPIDNDGKIMCYIDSSDEGNTRLTTIAKSDAHLIERLRAAKPVGPLTDPATGWIDGKKTLSLIAAMGKMDAALTDEDHELLNKVLNGQRVNWTVNSSGNRFNIMFDVPVLLVKNIAQNSDALMKVAAKMNVGN